MGEVPDQDGNQRRRMKLLCKMIIKPEEIESARTSNCLYGWKRGNQWLYIGISQNGIKRIYSHDVIGVVEPFQKQDRVVLWSVNEDCGHSLILAEALLIELLKPKYNKDNKYLRWFSFDWNKIPHSYKAIYKKITKTFTHEKMLKYGRVG